MPTRRNLFIVHSWDEWPIYARLTTLLQNKLAGLANYSIPPWRALEGSDVEVIESINHRISTATAVVVLNTPGLHRRVWSDYEMRAAVAMDKRIVVVQPHGEYHRPIPQVLDDHLYRVAPFRTDVVGRAIQGQYPQDNRIFDIAEKADRRQIVQLLSAGVGIASFALLVKTTQSIRKLQTDLSRKGVRLEWTGRAVGEIALYALGGAALAGTVTALLTNDTDSALAAAAAGGVVGAAIGASRVYRAALHGTSELRVLTVEPQ